jgi:cytoskeletal protein RodZ
MGIYNNKQSGFSAIEAVLILVIVGMLGFTGWYVWHAKQTADKTLSADNSNVPSFSKKQASTAHTTTSQSNASSSNYLIIKEWGVKLSVNDPIVTSPVYNAPVNLPDGNQEVVLGSSSWDNLKCQGTNTVLNIKQATGVGDDLIRGTDKSKVLADQVVGDKNYTQIGNYYYTYQNNTGIGSCNLNAQDTKTYQAVNTAFTANWNAHKVVSE